MGLVAMWLRMNAADAPRRFRAEDSRSVHGVRAGASLSLPVHMRNLLRCQSPLACQRRDRVSQVPGQRKRAAPSSSASTV